MSTPIPNAGLKMPQPRDQKKKPRRFVGHDLELTEKEMQGADQIKIAWADKVADHEP